MASDQTTSVRDIDPERLSSVLLALYAATIEPSSRAMLPEKMAQAFDANSCLLHMREEGVSHASIVGATANITALMPSYSQYYYALDGWAEAVSRRLELPLLGEEMVPERELVASEWYADLCRPYDIHHIVGSGFALNAKVQGQIGVHRAPKARPFDAADRAMLGLIIPHLKQAYRLIRMVDQNTRAKNLGFEVLAALSTGVIVVTGDNVVRLVNAAAERILEQSSALVVKNGRLMLADPRLDDQLRETVHRASLAAIGESLAPGGTIAVGGNPPQLSLIVMPLPPDAGSGTCFEQLAAILLSEGTAHHEFSSEAMRTTYGLTPAETRLLLSLLKGQSLSEYASDCGLSPNTVQSQIKAVFAKTGTHRQADLVLKVMSNPILRLAR